MLNAFRIAQIGSLTIFGMVKGFMDEYEDESGIDLINSINQYYSSSNSFYSNGGISDDLTSGQTFFGSGDLINLANCFDDNSLTRNSATAGLTINVTHIGVQFNVAKHIGQISLKVGNDNTGNQLTAADIQYSDNGSDWTTVASITPVNNDDVQTFDLPISGPHIYWRILATGYTYLGIGNGMSENEIEMKIFVPTNNMTLLSNAQTAAFVPIESRIVIFEEDIDTVTLNSDLKAYISRDNGTTFSQVTLEDEGNYITGARILSGVVDLSTQPSGSNMKYKVETLNLKKLNLHGTAVSWK
jgi:hypothetical protein